jgi:SAM-dependent methyltransferase
VTIPETRIENSKIWAREANNHYVEPSWVAERLFAEEKFTGKIVDPCCGFGRIVTAARQAGYEAIGCDLIDRGFEYYNVANFLTSGMRADNFVFNPPFDLSKEFALHALNLAERKVAMVYPVRRLNAAHWLAGTPLYRIWYLTPRPSMPPGHVLIELEQMGKNPSGGKQDFCVLVWLKGFEGEPTARWLRRDA